MKEKKKKAIIGVFFLDLLLVKISFNTQYLFGLPLFFVCLSKINTSAGDVKKDLK